MAASASGSLEQVFDKPLETKTSPFDSIPSKKHNNNPIKPVHDSCSSFPDMYFTNQLHSMENSDLIPSTNSNNKDYISTKRHTNMNAESLFMCTEGLGFESFDDVVEDLKKKEEDINDQSKQQHETKHIIAVSEMILTSDQPKRSSSRIKGSMELPPLISSLGVSGKPWVSLKSFRSQGRFILNKEVQIPNQELLHACREDGRLKLQFVQSDDEEA